MIIKELAKERLSELSTKTAIVKVLNIAVTVLTYVASTNIAYSGAAFLIGEGISSIIKAISPDNTKITTNVSDIASKIITAKKGIL